MSVLSNIPRTPALLVLCVVLSIVVHSVPMLYGFGESDAARLGVLAAEWHETGSMTSYFYEVRTSPLYIHGLKLMLDAGVPAAKIPLIINWINVALGSLVLIPLFYLFRAMSTPAAATVSCVLISAAPAFWLASIYGMPHLPGYVCFVTALWLYVRALKSETIRWWDYAATVSLGVIAMTLKSDVVLCYGAFLGAAFYLRRIDKAPVLVAIATPVIGFLVAVMYARLIAPSADGLSTSVDDWAKTFPFTLESLTNAANRSVLVNTTGRVLTSAIVLATAFLATQQRHRRRVLFALFWALPPILFWGLKMGNSGRHVMAGYTALLFLVAVAVVNLFPRRAVQWSFVAALIVGNYFGGPNVGGSLSPMSRLFELKREIRVFGNYRHAMGRIAAEFETERKLYAGAPTNPYVVWESLIRARSFRVLSDTPRVYEIINGGPPTQFRIDVVPSGETVGPSRDWFIFTFEPGIVTLNYPEFRETKDRLAAIAAGETTPRPNHP